MFYGQLCDTYFLSWHESDWIMDPTACGDIEMQDLTTIFGVDRNSLGIE